MKVKREAKAKTFTELGRLIDAKLAAAQAKSRRTAAERREKLAFLKTFLKDPKVASVSPSSKYVVRKVVEKVELDGALSLVEYGPGDGVITRGLLGGLSPDGTLIAIERNPAFVKKLQAFKDKRLVLIQGDVRLTEKYLRAEGLDQVDRVVSGIPFSFLKPKERREVLAMTGRLLKPGGRFVVYQFTATLIPLLKRHFKQVDIGYELRNLPPLFVFTCVK